MLFGVSFYRHYKNLITINRIIQFNLWKSEQHFNRGWCRKLTVIAVKKLLIKLTRYLQHNTMPIYTDNVLYKKSLELYVKYLVPVELLKLYPFANLCALIFHKEFLRRDISWMSFSQDIKSKKHTIIHVI